MSRQLEALASQRIREAQRSSVSPLNIDGRQDTRPRRSRVGALLLAPVLAAAGCSGAATSGEPAPNPDHKPPHILIFKNPAAFVTAAEKGIRIGTPVKVEHAQGSMIVSGDPKQVVESTNGDTGATTTVDGYAGSIFSGPNNHLRSVPTYVNPGAIQKVELDDAEGNLEVIGVYTVTTGIEGVNKAALVVKKAIP
ncbi:MAG TPA: hypothetical protein VLF93_07465 [Candidatus Saccharimonadales bacterium]|nr:hypothetical protein [Candidatus Saccharimonadales bacterium]